MSTHREATSRNCPHCAGAIVYISIKNPYVDEGGYSCPTPDCAGFVDVEWSARASARMQARAEEAEERGARLARDHDEEE